MWIAGGLASSSPAFAISAAATLPLRCASRPASSSNVSKIANEDGPSWMANHEIVIGMQCDRTGATQIVGTILCPGKHDYIALVNSKGGVEGHKIKALEVDHEYKVPPGVESYERHKKEGAVSFTYMASPMGP